MKYRNRAQVTINRGSIRRDGNYQAMPSIYMEVMKEEVSSPLRSSRRHHLWLAKARLSEIKRISSSHKRRRVTALGGKALNTLHGGNISMRRNEITNASKHQHIKRRRSL